MAILCACQTTTQGESILITEKSIIWIYSSPWAAKNEIVFQPNKYKFPTQIYVSFIKKNAESKACSVEGTLCCNRPSENILCSVAGDLPPAAALVVCHR